MSSARLKLDEGVQAQLQAVDALAKELEATRRELQAARDEISELAAQVQNSDAKRSPDELTKLLLAKFSCVGDLDPLVTLLTTQDGIKVEESAKISRPVLVIAQPTVAATFLNPSSVPAQAESVGSAIELSVEDDLSDDELVRGCNNSAQEPMEPKKRAPRKRRGVPLGGLRKSLRNRTTKQN